VPATNGGIIYSQKKCHGPKQWAKHHHFHFYTHLKQKKDASMASLQFLQKNLLTFNFTNFQLYKLSTKFKTPNATSHIATT
jgi:hypothetical protein